MAVTRFEPETRRVQLTGGATLIVSLPKEWTRQVSLRPGDEVLVIPQPDLSLLIVPKKMVKIPSMEASIEVTEELSDTEHLERVLLSYYLAGYDLFKLDFDASTLGLKRQVKDIVRRKLTGVEIIEEGRNTLIIQNLINVPDINIRDILSKLIKTIMGMLDDLKIALENGDKSVAMDIVERDNEVDKFYWLLNRQLKRILVSKYAMSLSGIQDPRNILEYAMINKSMERAADHVVKIAYEVLTLGDRYVSNIPREIRYKLSELVNNDASLMSSIGKSLSDELSLRELNKLIDTVKHSIKASAESLLSSLNKATDPAVLASLRLILDSIVRIAEYASDVAESLINLTIEGST